MRVLLAFALIALTTLGCGFSGFVVSHYTHQFGLDEWGVSFGMLLALVDIAVSLAMGAVVRRVLG